MRRLRHAWALLILGPEGYRMALDTRSDHHAHQRDRLTEKGVFG